MLAACEGYLGLAPDSEGGVDVDATTRMDAASDGSAPDGRTPDSGAADASRTDTGVADTGVRDTGVADTGVRDTGPGGPCARVTCGAGETCAAATGDCVCAPGFISSGTGCVAPAPGDPAGRSSATMCAIWSAGHEENAGSGWTPGATTCDLGALNAETIPDTLRRLSMFRDLCGLGPVTDIPSQQAGEQACAVMMNAEGRLDHAPATSFACYTAEGAAAAGRSNLALGVSTPASAIDLYVGDERVASLGHRRWALNFRLGRVSIGYAGRAQCLGVFDTSGTSTRSWTSWPNPGPTPRAAIPSVWSYLSTGSVSGASVRVTRVSDGMDMPVTTAIPTAGYGAAAVAFTPTGWSAASGETYRVEITGLSSGVVSYEVSPVDC